MNTLAVCLCRRPGTWLAVKVIACNADAERQQVVALRSQGLCRMSSAPGQGWGQKRFMLLDHGLALTGR